MVGLYFHPLTPPVLSTGGLYDQKQEEKERWVSCDAHRSSTNSTQVQKPRPKGTGLFTLPKISFKSTPPLLEAHGPETLRFIATYPTELQ